MELEPDRCEGDVIYSDRCGNCERKKFILQIGHAFSYRNICSGCLRNLAEKIDLFEIECIENGFSDE